MAGNLQQQSFKSMQSISIFQRISDLLGISHEFKLPSDGGGIGTMSKSSGEWSGIIGDLLDGKVDIVVSEMAVLSKRHSSFFSNLDKLEICGLAILLSAGDNRSTPSH